MLVAAVSIILFVCLAGALLWRLAVYALPVWCGGAAAWWVYGAEAGFAASMLAGLAAAMAILILGHWTLGVTKSPLLRAVIGLVFAAPAAIAGYHAAHGIAAAFAIGGLSAYVLGSIAAAATGVAAWGGVMRDRQT